MTLRDAAWAVVGWQLAIVFRFATDVLFDYWDRRKARLARAERAVMDTTPTAANTNQGV